MAQRILASALPQHEAAELYRLMVFGIEDTAVFLMDRNGVVTVWNKGAESMKGYSGAEIIGRHLSLLYTDQDRQRGCPEHNLHMAEKNNFYSEEAWRKRKDGSLFWAHISLTALRSDTEELLGFSKVTMDLTRHRLLEQCEKERAEIDLILRAAESGTWKWHIARDQVSMSAHLLGLLGYSNEARVMAFDNWLAYVHPDDRNAFRICLETVRSRPTAAPLETELRFLRQGLGFHWFFLRANWHYDTCDNERMIMGACVAIDTFKQAEREKQQAWQELEQERARFANILEQMPSGVVLAEAPSGKLTYQNRAAAGLLGRGIENIDSYHDYNSYSLFDARGVPVRYQDMPLARRLLGQNAPPTEELTYRRDDGVAIDIAITSASIIDPDGVARLAVAVMHDVTELKRAQLSEATEKERALVTLAAITDAVITVDRHACVTSLNPAAARLSCLSGPFDRARELSEVLDPQEPDGITILTEAIDRCLRERRVVAALELPHLCLHSHDGTRYAIESAVAPVILANGELIGAVLVLHDVTESKRLLRRLGFEASHDALTGLVNRREFELRLQRAIDRAHHSGGAAGSALLYMDLDQFKIVNDTCGHSAGDNLLRLLANNYAEHVRERDTLARIGGDEFALIVEHCEASEALAVANKVLEVTRSFRYACKNQVFQIGVSIGLTPIDHGTVNVEEALRRADHACYIAKERGRNRVYVHQHDDQQLAQRRSDMHWVARLANALQSDQLELYCQPIVALQDGPPCAHYEILLRLRADGAEPILPGAFLPAAERYDVMLQIDRYVLRRTLAWLAAHPGHTEQLDMCSINLSRRSLADQSFHQFAADLIDSSKVAAHKLCFEITENGAIADMQKTIAFIEALSARGCRFSLDDFGTGMTSFSYLKQLPVDYIKIDGALIQMMSSSEVDFEMVRFTNDISHMMGRKTIAEYVTDPAILAKLKSINVDFAQGFWVGKPRPLMP